MEEADLTPRQREVVKADSPVVLVLGSAGTGKTTTALWAARAALHRANDPSARVAFLTFSRTAVDQISARSRTALSSLEDRVEISTFHGFAFRLVRAFARYAGFGSDLPDLQSPAQVRLHGPREGLLSYDDLIPLALKVLRSKRVRDLLAARWPLIICDEFQDTSDEHWALLDCLRSASRLLLLADGNQMIYSFLPGVSLKRLTHARALAQQVIELEPVSHRDPSGAIPALAAAVLQRDFQAVPIRAALQHGRLRVRRDVHDDDLVAVISEELREAWMAGSRDYGIFGHSNEGIASLGHHLADAGIDHVLIGLPDAQGEAIAAMATMCRHAVDAADLGEVRTALATFLTACSRGKEAPRLAVSLARGQGVPPVLNERVQLLSAGLREARADIDALANLIATAWESLGILAGNRPWARAVPIFGPVLRRAARRRSIDLEATTHIDRDAKALRSSALLESSRIRLPPTQLMNFHQTKGREADAVILVYRNGDVLAGWRDTEPYEESSRVLYVSLTRARQRVSVILPPDPHPLVAAFANIV